MSRLTGLLPGRTYAVRSRCRNSAGTSPWGDVLELRTACATPDRPPPPQLEKAGRTVLRLFFLPPAELNGSRITGWTLEACEYPVQGHRHPGKYHVAYEGTDRFVSVQDLASGCAYKFRVAAQSSSGPTAFSEPVVLRTCAGPPAVPLPGAGGAGEVRWAWRERRA